jgi:DNA topoisomerase-1
MDRDLVIIESSGKLRTLHGIFAQIGLHADLCATIGHFLENPHDLTDLAVGYRDGEFIETKRQPHRPESFSYLRDQISRCQGRILLATDNDQEGHVIAQDVANLIQAMGIRRPVYRMLFSGLDAASVRRALDTLRPIDASKAIPGTARRIVDRLIGGMLSDFDAGKPVGRVQSALFGLCDQGVPHHHLNLKMPAADGGKPFIGRLPVFGATSPAQLIAELGVFELPPAAVGGSEIVSMSEPMNYGDALLTFHGALSLDVEQAGDLLQQMYEAGEITYPRTGARAFTVAGAIEIERMARVKGILAFKRDRLPLLDEAASDAPHEAIRVLNDALLKRLDLGKPAKLHASIHDAALSLIARRSLEAGIPVKRDIPNLQHAPDWAKEVNWQRDIRQSMLPWRAAELPAVMACDAKSVLVEEMMSANIGRPSTWASHAGKFVARELLDESMQLTAKGRALLEAAPPALKDVLTSARIEALLNSENESIGDLVVSALQVALGNNRAALAAIIEKVEAVADELEDLEKQYRPAPGR